MESKKAKAPISIWMVAHIKETGVTIKRMGMGYKMDRIIKNIKESG
jgi:hypothetical protein